MDKQNKIDFDEIVSGRFQQVQHSNFFLHAYDFSTAYFQLEQAFALKPYISEILDAVLKKEKSLHEEGTLTIDFSIKLFFQIAASLEISLRCISPRKK